MTQTQEYRPVQEIPNGTTEKTPRLNVVLTKAAETAADVIAVTMQVYEYQTALAEKKVLDVWISTNDQGDCTPGDEMTATTGVLLAEIEANGYQRIITDAAGTAVVAFTENGDAPRFCNVALGGKIFSLALPFLAATGS